MSGSARLTFIDEDREHEFAKHIASQEFWSAVHARESRRPQRPRARLQRKQTQINSATSARTSGDGSEASRAREKRKMPATPVGVGGNKPREGVDVSASRVFSPLVNASRKSCGDSRAISVGSNSVRSSTRARERARVRRCRRDRLVDKRFQRLSEPAILFADFSRVANHLKDEVGLDADGVRRPIGSPRIVAVV